MQESVITHDKTDASITPPQRTKDTTPVTSSANSSRLAEIESSIQSIDSESLSLKSKFKGLQAEFQKVITSVLQHSKQIQAIQSDMRGLSAMVLELRNGLLPNDPPLPPVTHSHPCI
jgi:chromosome segregation ATPase